jgi:hypothetical protein
LKSIFLKSQSSASSGDASVGVKSIVDAVRQGVQVIDGYVHLTGPEKKAEVLELASQLYDKLAESVKIPYVPKVVSKAIFAKIKPVVMVAIDQVIELAYEALVK